ncbi:MAG: dihydroneopterin aldolase [Proteobacteria bacterium]|nr:dihydroneopterin aldolase [Pseudomonadota bacterium]HQR04109.1 dihydroneopterin aldolase [Rhodocyclaceae bacterium]
MDFIFIDELRVDAKIGIYARELCVTQPLELCLRIGLPEGAGADDDISRTIDYAAVVARIRSELGERRFKLLETLGEFVLTLLLDEFGASTARISIAKLGILPGVRRIGLEMERSR